MCREKVALRTMRERESSLAAAYCVDGIRFFVFLPPPSSALIALPFSFTSPTSSLIALPFPVISSLNDNGDSKTDLNKNRKQILLLRI